MTHRQLRSKGDNVASDVDLNQFILALLEAAYRSIKPVLIASAVAFAVSVGQYLPTLFAGSGRVATLTTEAVTLSAGADRRVIGTWALMQALLPWVGYLLAALVPALLYARRRALIP